MEPVTVKSSVLLFLGQLNSRPSLSLNLSVEEADLE